MKERKSALLVLSALVAFALTACDPEPAQSSTPAQSGANSSATSAISSSAEESSSMAPSSTAAEDLDNWAGQAWIGQYQGGFTTLIINEDKSTSWDTDTTHYPAQIEVMDNGIFHIYSTNAVPAAERVDIYTDGTMAYFSHDANAKDRFIADKNASYEAAIAFAKNANGSLIFGSIAVSSSKTKFFRYANGAYQFDVKVEVSYGGTIEALGAIFDVTIGGETSTYHTTVAGDGASGKFATIESYQVVVTEYYGEAGDLVIAKNGNETVYIKLDNYEIDLDDVTEENGAIVIKEGARTLDDTDPSHMEWVYNATKYILDAENNTYTKEDATSREDVFQQLDMSQSSFSMVVGADGNLWAAFTPTTGGFFNVSETVGTGDGYYNYDYIAIYLAESYPYGSPYSYAAKYASGYYDTAAISNFEVAAGQTYIIKASNYDDIYNTISDEGSESEGATVTISYSYVAFDIATYTGDQGDLTVETYQGAFRGAALDGVAIPNATKTDNTISSTNMTVDFSDPSDPQKTTTNIVIVLDPTTMTYSYESQAETESAFHVFTEADSGNDYSAIVGNDGNLWAVFTPVSAGYLTIEEIATTSANETRPDGYLAIYDANATSFTTANALRKEDNGYNFPKISNFLLDAGRTYVIKAGGYADRDRVLGGTGSSYAGQTETINFVFSSILTQTFTGASGDLLLSTENGEFRGATLAGTALNNAELIDNGDNTLTLSIIGAGTVDMTDPLDPIRTSTDTVYTLDVVNFTYTEASSTNSRHLFQEVDANTTSVTAVVGEDGNLWAKFSPTVGGYLSLEEIVTTSAAATSPDGYLAIYDSTATAFTTTYALKKEDNGYNFPKINNFVVEAGKTYIIKAGAYADRDKVVGGATASAYAGQTETINFSFEAFNVATYTGDEGDLVINKAGDLLVSVTLNGAAVSNGTFDEQGNFVIMGTATIDNSDRLNPTMTSTDKIYALDEDNGTYAVSSEIIQRNIFHEVSETCVVTDVVANDGNLWIKFSPEADGTITVEELISTTTDGYIAIYKSTAANFTDDYNHTYAAAYNDSSAALSGAGKITDFEVHAGETYIIKAGAYADRGNAVTATSANNKGKTESVDFIFNAYASETYTSEGGADLIISKKGDEVLSIKLGDAVLEGAVLEGNKVTVKGEINQDAQGNYSSTNRVYTLNNEEGVMTYTVEDVLVPYAASTNYTLAQGASYSFTYNEADGTYTSNNAGVQSSTATMSFTFAEDGVFTFGYNVSSEGTTTLWDYLEVRLNGQVVSDPAKIGGVSGMTGSMTISVSAGDVLTFNFVKDSSGNGGDDCAIISKVIFFAAVPENQQQDPQTSEPTTSEPTTSEPINSEPISSEPASSEPVSSEPVSSEPESSESDTSGPVSSDPIEAE